MGMIITPDSHKKVFTLRQEIELKFPNAIFIEDFDHCIIDVTRDGSVVYSVNEIVATLMSGEHNLCESDAYDYLDYMIIPQYSDFLLEPKYK